MIARTRRGWTRKEDADRYVEYLNATSVPRYRGDEGNRGVQVLRRVVEDRAEFVYISRWESVEALTAHVGDDLETAIFYPEDEAYLVEREMAVTNYEVVIDA